MRRKSGKSEAQNYSDEMQHKGEPEVQNYSDE